MPHVGIALFKLLLWLCNSTSRYFLQMIFSKTWISEGAGKANVNSSSCKFSFNSTRRSGINWCALIHQKCYLQRCKSCPSSSLFVVFLEKSLNMQGNKIWLKTGLFSNFKTQRPCSALKRKQTWCGRILCLAISIQMRYVWFMFCYLDTLYRQSLTVKPPEKKHQNILHVYYMFKCTVWLI